MIRRATVGPRRTVAYFPEVESASEVVGRAFLFVRDLPIGVMPYRSFGSGGYSATLSSGDAERARELAQILDDSNAYGLSDSYADFVRDVTELLAYVGEVHFELVRKAGDELAPPGGLANLELARLPLGRVWRVGRWVVQFVPRASRTKLGCRWVVAPRESIWTLRLPRSLGRPWRHRRLIRALSRLGMSPPEFTMTPAFGSDVKGFSLSAWRLLMDAQLEHRLRRWGSIPSMQRIEGTTEFYLMQRTLEFRLSQARIRESIDSDVNELLMGLGVSDSIKVLGLPGSEEIAEAIRKMQSGEIDFKAAVESTRIP